MADVQRHWLVDFSPNDNSAILSSLDRITSTQTHRYTWNANLGDERSDGDIKAAVGREAGRSTFLLQGKNGWLKGWVLHPAEVTISAGDPLQIDTQGQNTYIWVAMLTGSGPIPVGRMTGKGLASALTVVDSRISYDTETQRIVVQRGP